MCYAGWHVQVALPTMESQYTWSVTPIGKHFRVDMLSGPILICHLPLARQCRVCHDQTVWAVQAGMYGGYGGYGAAGTQTGNLHTVYWNCVSPQSSSVHTAGLQSSCRMTSFSLLKSDVRLCRAGLQTAALLTLVGCLDLGLVYRTRHWPMLPIKA